MSAKKNYTTLTGPVHRLGRVFALTFFALVTLFFSSCQFWNEPVRDYFEKWTQEVSIAKYELVGIESYTDKDGNLCISSDQDATVTLFMINPYHYSNVTVSSGDITTTASGTFPTITQDSNDTTLLHFTYPRDFLIANDCGGEIGATINVRHPMNQTTKEYSFTLKSNSRPPLIEDAAIMTTGDSNDQKFVLAFRCPPLDDCKEDGGIHHDIVSITIDGQTYPVTPASNGELFFGDSMFTRTRPTPLNSINKNFAHSELAVYFCKNEGATEENKNGKTYTISYTDSAGFTNPLTIDARLPGMGDPLVYDNDNAETEAVALDDNELNILHIDDTENAVCSTVTIKLPEVNDIGLPVAGNNPKIYWALYNDSGNLISPENGPTANDSPVHVTIPTEGEYRLKVYAAADGHLNSFEKTYRLRLDYVQLDPPEVEDNDSNILAHDGTVNHLHIDSSPANASWTTIRLTQADTDSTGKTIYGGAISYTLLNGSNSEITISDSSEFASATQEADGSITLKLKQEGDYTLRTHTTAIGHRDSVTSEYKLKLEYERLPPPVVKKGSDTPLTAGTGSNTNNYIAVGSDNNATVKVCVPTEDINGNSFLNGGDVTVHYRLERGFAGTDPTDSTATTTGETNLDTTPGQWVITAVAKKPGYRDSEVVTYKIRAFNCDIYVKSSSAQDSPGNNDSGDGTEAFPYASITRAVEEIGKFNVSGNDYIIHVVGEVTGNQSIAYISGMAKSITIQGEGTDPTLNGGGSGTVLSNIVSFPIYIKDLKITGGNGSQGGGIYSQGNITLQPGTEIIQNSANTGNKQGGGIFINSGSLTIESGVTINGNEAGSCGGGIYMNAGSLTIESGATISENNATYGGGIYINSNSGTHTIKGGTITGNTASDGAAIYALKTFTVTEDAQIASSNDVYLANGKYINIQGNLNNTNVATITPGITPWHRGTQVLSGDVPDNPHTKFTLDKSGWSIRKASSSSGKLDAPLYVKADGNDTDNTGASATDAYATIKAAVDEIIYANDSSMHYTINIVGTLTGANTIPGLGNPGKAQSITLEGTGTGGILDAQNESDKRPLTVNCTTVPVIIKNLTITGGNVSGGGGIWVNGGVTVKLADGATVTGNTASSSGGGVYVGSGAKLFMYGSALIGDKTTSTHAESGAYANNGGNSGGGIYNAGGTVYIGYDDVNSPKAIDEGYGIRYNYATNGGGIYNGYGGTLNLNSGHISYNGCEKGGGIYHDSGTSNITGGTIEGNYSSTNGGGIYINGGTVNISDGTISSNSSDNKGGGIYNNGCLGLSISGGKLESNSANTYGGAIYSGVSSFSLSGSANIPSTGTRLQNDVCLDASYSAAINISDTLTGSGNIYLDGYENVNNKFYKYGYVALRGATESNYSKFKVIKPSTVDWKVNSDGKIVFAGNVTVNYNLNLDSTASPAGSSLTLKKSGNTITSPDSIPADNFGTNNAQPAKPSPEYIIVKSGTEDIVKKFTGWDYNVDGTADLAASATSLPITFLNGLTSPTIYLKAIWTQTTDTAEIKSAWENTVYNQDFYGKHDTFKVYTVAQFKQIFDTNTTGSLCKLSNTFNGKTITILNDLDVGTIKTYAGETDFLFFEGTLTGAGHTIKANIVGDKNVGLVSQLTGDGVIQGITLSGTVTGGSTSSYTGGIVGIMGYGLGGGTIQTCKVYANITDTGTFCVGGIVGLMYNNSTVQSCEVYGTVEGNFSAGGIAGKINNSYNACTVQSNAFYGTVKHTGSSGTYGKIVGTGSISNGNGTNTASGSLNPATGNNINPSY